MTREDQLREARHFLGLPHPADKDDVSDALQYIEFRNQAFLVAKKRHSKPAKRVARSLAQAIWRGQRAGLPMPHQWALLFHLYQDIGTTRSGPPKRTDGFKQRLALQQAFWLLSDRGRPCVAGSKGEWCKLAAILLGYPKPTAGLLSQARQLRVQFKLEKMKIPGQN
jgi:hypothetical protein